MTCAFRHPDSFLQAFLLTAISLFLALALPQRGRAQERSYEEMRAEVVQLFQAESFEAAAAILEEALDEYPSHLLANTTNLAIMRVSMGDPEGAVEVLFYGLDHDHFYSKYAFLGEFWAPVREASAWGEFRARNEMARARAQTEVRPRLEVSLPAGFDPDRRYPLFIALHGGGENLDVFIPEWTSPLLRREFIMAFPQSTQLVAMNGYNWTEDVGKSLREIQKAYQEVVEAYPVDEEQVLVGGFSSGGVASMEIVLRNALTVRGFVALCPGMPEAFTPESVRAARDRGIRGTILTTEMDGRVEQQRRMDEVMTEEGLPHEFHITPNIGHWYPDDLGERIDRAIAHIRQEG
jgi:predicted esterase